MNDRKSRKGREAAKAERLALQGEINRRGELERVSIERIDDAGDYQPRALPLKVEHLRGVRTQPLKPHEGTYSLAYLCHRCRDTGEDIYWLCKLIRVEGMTADCYVLAKEEVIKRVRIGCFSVVLTV